MVLTDLIVDFGEFILDGIDVLAAGQFPRRRLAAKVVRKTLEPRMFSDMGATAHQMSEWQSPYLTNLIA